MTCAEGAPPPLRACGKAGRGAQSEQELHKGKEWCEVDRGAWGGGYVLHTLRHSNGTPLPFCCATMYCIRPSRGHGMRSEIGVQMTQKEVNVLISGG